MRLHPPPSSGGRAVHLILARPLDQTFSEARRWHDGLAELKPERSLRVHEAGEFSGNGAGRDGRGSRRGVPAAPSSIGKAGPSDLLEGSSQADVGRAAGHAAGHSIRRDHR